MVKIANIMHVKEMASNLVYVIMTNNIVLKT